MGGFGVLLIALCSFAATRGAMDLGYGDLSRVLLAKLGFGEADRQTTAILWHLRIPRILLGAIAGAALAMAGAALQGLYRNSMADPALIGVSAGGAVGAVATVLLGITALMPVGAMLGAAGTTLLVYRIGSSGGRLNVATMLLAGLAVNALAGAVVGLLLQLVKIEQFRGTTFWLLGSLAGANWNAVGLAALLAGIPMLLLPRFSRALNALLLGEAEAFHLGHDVQLLKRSLVILTAVMVGAVVAFCGTIGFVGLIVPHAVRLLLGPDHRYLLPGSALAGAALLVLADLIARTLDAPAELPVGVLTALLGAPFFLYLVIADKSRLKR